MQSAAKAAKSKSTQSGNFKIPAFQARRSQAELAAMGKALRDKCPRVSHAEWKPPNNRPDPVRLIEESERTKTSGTMNSSRRRRKRANWKW